MVRYNIYNKGNDKLFNEIARRYNVDKAIARIIVNRDVALEDIDDYLNPDISKLYNPYRLKDIKKGASIIRDAIDASKRIRIIGDYDVDGVMSTYVLLKGLITLGAEVDYQIPHRVEDGYGLNINIIKRAIEDGIDLIVTCDNGVSALSEIEYARENGIDVVITDHHELMSDNTEDGKKEVLPDANAIINPKREGDNYPFKKLCGATVAWKLIIVLFDMMDVIPNLSVDSLYMEPEEKTRKALLDNHDYRPIMRYLEYVAFATIGDVMELVDENRIIVKFGLMAMNHTDNIGLLHLIDNRLSNTTSISPYHIGFVLGPCINASGRLDTAAKSLELLLAGNDTVAASITKELVDLNEERKEQTVQGTNKAFDIVETEYPNDKILVVYIPDIHESVAGIVAGRVREKYSKPAIILCDGEEYVKGSGRSIENYNMYEGLHNCKDLFVKFGGHPMAAGMSLVRENVPVLRMRLNEDCTLTEEELVDIRTIDLTLNLDYISYELIEQLERLEPFGNGNNKPLFAHKDTSLHSIRRIGADNRFIKMEFDTRRGVIEGLYFQDGDELEERIVSAYGREELNKAYNRQSNNICLTIMFYPQINDYKGNKSIQIVLSDVVI